MPSPIRAFVGPNGHGKTLAAVELVVRPALDAGRSVVSTCKIDHPNARLLTSWREVTDLRDCVLLLDEISSQLPSRGAMGAPAGLIRTVNQLRKADIELCWTAPNWARADVALREVTQEVTVCRGYLGDRFERVREVPPWWRVYPDKARTLDGVALRRSPRWPSMSLFHWVTYDAVSFDEFTLHAVTDVKPTEKLWYWRPWHRGQFLYETLEGVSLLDHVDEVGVCLACGGTRRRHACTCAPSTAKGAGARSVTTAPAPVVVGEL